MSADWKPGDYAIVTCPRRFLFETSDTTTALCKRGQGAHWYAVGYDERGWTDGETLSATATPLVVIDPEDREQVERLMDLLWETNDEATASNDMQAALREFANPTPPRPEEPQGLGAVVEDADGERWVRSHPNINPWTQPHLSGAYSFDKIAAVRVLSEGVTS